MKPRDTIPMLAVLAMALAGTGCRAPGKPGPGIEVERPDQVQDFATLYAQNCAACHGDRGRYGAAISLANPVYLAMATTGDIEQVTAAGVKGTLMPGFGKAAGGMLTGRQIAILAQGMQSAWARPAALHGQTPPAYASSLQGDAQRGQQAFTAYCARCHGADGTGASEGKMKTGSLVDPAYLSLVSEQGLRSTIIAGKPEQGMPDWRSYAAGAQAQPQALTDQQIADIVAWLESHRVPTPGQPYAQQP